MLDWIDGWRQLIWGNSHRQFSDRRQGHVRMSEMGLGRVKTLLHDAGRRGRTQAAALLSIWANFTATRPELILTRRQGSFTPYEPQRHAPAPVSRTHRRQQRLHPDH